MAQAGKSPAAFTAPGTMLLRKLRRALPDPWYCRINYLLRTKRILHLNNPRAYSEKIQWLKLYGQLERYAPYVDKYDVRKYVEGIIGPEYLVPLIGVWSDFDDIAFDEMPEQFALKATHGQGYNFVCRDKSALDLTSLRETATNWISQNFYRAEREPQYRYLRPRLIAETYLEDDSGSLRDYKFPCFDGVPYMVQVIADRSKSMTENIYDCAWNLLPVREKGYPNARHAIAKPALLNDMLTIAAKLSAGFPFVRVDLYCTGEKIYFGELTFTPASGIVVYEPSSFDIQLGRMLDLSKFSVTAPAEERGG
jgi:TupA-like ATPgrasp